MAAKKTRRKTRPTEQKKTRDQILKDNAWPPGVSGNPKGRPKGSMSLTTTVKEMADWKAPPKILTEYRTIFPELPDDATIVQVLAARSLLKALDLKQGDVMAKEIWERIDGKVPYPISGPAGGPVRVKFDFSILTVKELDILERLLGKVEQPETA